MNSLNEQHKSRMALVGAYALGGVFLGLLGLVVLLMLAM